MTSKLEEVARALAKADGKDPDAPAWIQYPRGNTFGICWRDQYTTKARAALEAMRGPTGEMVVAGNCAAPFDHTHPNLILGRNGPEAVFNAMIDAALEEK